jgi:hypothetical protein
MIASIGYPPIIPATHSNGGTKWRLAEGHYAMRLSYAIIRRAYYEEYRIVKKKLQGRQNMDCHGKWFLHRRICTSHHDERRP